MLDPMAEFPSAVKVNRPLPGDGRNDSLGRDPPNAYVLIVGDEQISGTIEREVAGTIGLRIDGGSAIARVTGAGCARDSSHNSAWVEPENCMIAGEVDITAGVGNQT
jgi:hypothetical protein